MIDVNSMEDRIMPYTREELIEKYEGMREAYFNVGNLLNENVRLFMNIMQNMEDIKHELYKLTTKGVEYLNSLEQPDNVERRINELVQDISTFFSYKNLKLSSKQILDLLLDILKENTQPLQEFLDPSNLPD